MTALIIIAVYLAGVVVGILALPYVAARDPGHSRYDTMRITNWVVFWPIMAPPCGIVWALDLVGDVAGRRWDALVDWIERRRAAIIIKRRGDRDE